MFLTQTLPNISFAINMLSKFSHKPQTPHLDATKHLFRYIKGMVDFGDLLLVKGGKYPHWIFLMPIGLGIYKIGNLPLGMFLGLDQASLLGEAGNNLALLCH
jgi:hypothetical protein